ncbi:MAG: magnesium transporter [Anaerolineae bacterium]|nr:magnesium transporter [Anaerolineae bacterium]
MSERQQNWESITEEIKEALAGRQEGRALEVFLALRPGDQVEVFDLLEEPERDFFLNNLDIATTAQLFTIQEDNETLEAAESLSIERLADVLDEMAPDEAADLLGDLPEEQASQALGEMEDAAEVLPLLRYPDETAGGRMTPTFLSSSSQATSEQAIDYLRIASPDQDVPYYLFVTDEAERLVGVVGLRELVVAPKNAKLETIMDGDVIFVPAETDQEEVAQEMTRYDLSALPVVDAAGRMIGVITHDDILDVITEEATEDIYRLANIGDFELEPDSDVRDHLKGRLPWLYLNTLTALFAAWVISNFEDLIAAIAVLAVFQSVVAGQGGNAGSQSVAVIVRAMALGRVPSKKVWGILGRQSVVGVLQGIAVGVVVGIGVTLWRGNPYLGLVIGLALVGNIFIAAIAGTLIPLALKAIGQDPAIASSVLVTAITDSLGFFIFLSLASIFMRNLL